MDGSLSPMLATADEAGGGDRQRRRLRPLVAGSSDPISDEMFRSFARFGSLPSDSPALAQVRRATAQTDKLREELGGVGDFTSPVAYPDTYFAHKLAGLAAYHRRRPADAGGDDPRRRAATTPTPTRPKTSTDNLRETCDGLLAFQRDLEARGLADRVLVEMWSEFGRRPEENGSGRDRPRRRRLRLRDRLQGEGRDGRRVPRPGEPRRQRQPACDERLPRHVLLAAGAVARPRRRRRSSPARRLRPAARW